MSVVIPRRAPVPLTYAVPEALAPFCAPGVRVRVPLRARETTGLVVGEAERPPEGVRVREVLEVLDLEPLAPRRLLSLAGFMARHYRAPLGDALATVFPARLFRSDVEEVEATEAAPSADPGTLPPLERRLLEELLARGGRARATALLAAAGTRSRAPLERLVARRLVRVRSRRRDRAPRIEVAAVRLADRPLDQLEARVGRAPRQRDVLHWLAEQGRPALEREVIAATGCSPAVIRALAAKGVLERFRQAPARRPRWALRPEEAGRPRLTEEQETAVATVTEAMRRGGYAPFLLVGITGSGKTEVYLRCLEAAVAAGRRGLVLVPEIGLTPAAVGAVERRFGDRVGVLHSAQSDGERWQEWQRIRRGEVDVVIGPRSALFAPLPDLGLIVVDEEHDAAYKQQESPRYNARDLALVAGKELGIPVLLCSATPSLEALALAERGLAGRLRLTRRVAGGTLPEVEVVDLRGEPPEPGEHGHRLFSRRLVEAIAATHARGEQAILLIQRRGWAPVLLCRECGHRIRCRLCSVSMVVHRRSRDLRCHYCGARDAIPGRCPSCSGELLQTVGAGTEKVAHLLAEKLPRLRVGILDRDTVRRRGALQETLGAFAAGALDVLVGTQMVAKGHHFPRVTLTGVVLADAILGLPDFRAAERTFQLLTQVAGRAGRGDRPGTVIVQTYRPDHPAVRHAARHDVDAFAAEELAYRRAFGYPPYTRMAVVRFEGEARDRVERAAAAAAAAVRRSETLRVRGPAPAPLERLRGHWRWQVLLTAPSRAILAEALDAVESGPLPARVRRVVDVDPLSTL